MTLVVKGKNTITLQGRARRRGLDLLRASRTCRCRWTGSDDADLEIRAAKYPQIRLITVPQSGTQEPQNDFNGQWEPCSPETVGGFSAVGYFFGRQLHETLDVPIGLINDAWGGSACEAWVPRDRLAADAKYKDLLDRLGRARDRSTPRPRRPLKPDRAEAAKAKAEGEAGARLMQNPDGQMHGNHRPGNIYNGVLQPTIGYGIRGVIWYQGESNAGRAYQYRDLFPLMIQTWRELWGQGDFPFYWVQLADFLPEKPEPADSAWAELREAQTMTLEAAQHRPGRHHRPRRGEGHPPEEQARRRQAAGPLGAGQAITASTSPARARPTNRWRRRTARSSLTFDHVDGGFRPFDVSEPERVHHRRRRPQVRQRRGQDRRPEQGRGLVRRTVSDPVAVRYAWADNPVCNLYNAVGLPATPFRTDDWPGVTVNKTR